MAKTIIPPVVYAETEKSHRPFKTDEVISPDAIPVSENAGNVITVEDDGIFAPSSGGGSTSTDYLYISDWRTQNLSQPNTFSNNKTVKSSGSSITPNWTGNVLDNVTISVAGVYQITVHGAVTYDVLTGDHNGVINVTATRPPVSTTLVVSAVLNKTDGANIMVSGNRVGVSATGFLNVVSGSVLNISWNFNGTWETDPGADVTLAIVKVG